LPLGIEHLKFVCKIPQRRKFVNIVNAYLAQTAFLCVLEVGESVSKNIVYASQTLWG